MKILWIVASLLAIGPFSCANAEEKQMQYVQLAELEIDPAQLGSFTSALKEHIESAIRVEPGVLVLYSVSEKDNPAHIKVLEIYRDVDAYKAHLASAHFKKYKTTTQKMVTSLKLVQTVPIMLGAKAH